MVEYGILEYIGLGEKKSKDTMLLCVFRILLDHSVVTDALPDVHADTEFGVSIIPPSVKVRVVPGPLAYASGFMYADLLVLSCVDLDSLVFSGVSGIK